MVKKILLFAILHLCNSIYGSAQELGNHGIGSPWYEGEIILGDDTQLAGFVRYNDKEGIISFKGYESEAVPESFRPEIILTMHYFDTVKKIDRRFVSVATKNKETKTEEVYLYEIIQEYSHFAILALQYPVVVVESKHNSNGITNTGSPMYIPATNSYVNSRPSRTVFSQTEEFYFVNENGERELYLRIVHQDIDGSLYEYSKTKGKIKDTSLPAKYFGEDKWNKVKAYAKSEDLEINNRQNLINILHYYTTLVNP